jgi:cytosine permease
MMERNLPQYVDRSIPVPRASRVSWAGSTFPTYAGIFLWVGFYLKLAEPTIGNASLSLCLWALLLAGVLCFGLYYYVPAMLGMKTGHPLYVVGTSTFGTTGGFLIPGILTGLLQIGWVAVNTSISAHFIMNGLHQTSRALYIAIALIWVYSLGWVAVKGIHYVGRLARYMNWIPLFMILFVLWANRAGIPAYHPAQGRPVAGFLNVLSIVIGFFATAGAAGTDFGRNNRDRRDVVLGGVFGIVLGTLVAGGVSILSVAGYLGRTPGIHIANYDYMLAISSVGALAPVMFFLFAAASIVPSCFSSFIASNSFNTMLPRIPRMVSTFAALTVSALLAVTGVADNLVGFFGIVGASFGPICGAMMADYLLAGRTWSGPRPGINWAGCIAWIVGFLIGVPELIPGLPASILKADTPSCLYAFAAGFLVYILLAKLGLRPAAVTIPVTAEV